MKSALLPDFTSLVSPRPERRPAGTSLPEELTERDAVLEDLNTSRTTGHVDLGRSRLYVDERRKDRPWRAADALRQRRYFAVGRHYSLGRADVGSGSCSGRQTTVVTVKPTLSLDFDKPLNPYTKGWDGGQITDLHPTIGARGALERLVKRYRLVVTTARTDHGVVHQALDDWGLSPMIDDVSNIKPPAVAYIDDKGVQFNTWDQALVDLQLLTGEQI